MAERTRRKSMGRSQLFSGLLRGEGLHTLRRRVCQRPILSSLQGEYKGVEGSLLGFVVFLNGKNQGLCYKLGWGQAGEVVQNCNACP